MGADLGLSSLTNFFAAHLKIAKTYSTEVVLGSYPISEYNGNAVNVHFRLGGQDLR
jgi:hypothetical protein